MGALADRLDGIRIRVRVPGTDIHAELTDRTRIDVSFGDGTYEWLHEGDLQHHLATLARLLVAGWMREYRAALTANDVPTRPPEELRNRDYEQACDELAASGASSDGRVTVSSVGLRDFQVRITPGTLRQLTETEFRSRVREATTAFLADHTNSIQLLKLRHLK